MEMGGRLGSDRNDEINPPARSTPGDLPRASPDPAHGQFFQVRRNAHASLPGCASLDPCGASDPPARAACEQRLVPSAKGAAKAVHSVDVGENPSGERPERRHGFREKPYLD